MEIHLSGTWGTVGHDFAGSYDAQVVCRQLGYDTRCMYKFVGIAHLCHPSAPFFLKMALLTTVDAGPILDWVLGPSI